MEYLSKNLHLYKRMKELAAQQETCLLEDRLDLFLQLADQREQLRLKITANEKKQESLLRESFAGKRETPVPLPAADIADVIRSIQETDRKTEELMLMRKEAFVSELKGIRNGRKAVRGYGGKSPRCARFVDRQS
jgi:hypothetical protein